MIRMVIHDGRQIRITRLPRWVLVLALAGAMFVGFLLLMLAAGLALVVVPAAIIAAGISTWLARRRLGSKSGPQVIEAQYRVLDRDW